jgi:hypothetical protein
VTPRVFISHTTRDPRDTELAHLIAQRLGAAGAQAWLAPKSIPVGDHWEDRIIGEILDQATHFFIIASNAAARSEWVLKEIGLAAKRMEKDKTLRILPLFVGDPGIFEGRPFLDQYQAVPFHTNRERQLLEVVKAVGGTLSPWVPQSSLVREKTKNFVGRNFAFEFFDRFFATNACGYVIVEGVPGVGKSSLLAEFVRRQNVPAHFNVQAQGVSRVVNFVESLHAQLGMRFDLDQALPENAARDGRHVEQLLDESAGRLQPGDRLVIVVDALDELEMSGPLGANPLFLPTTLPAGVFLLVSRRAHTAFLQIDGRTDVLDLMTHTADNRSDAELFIRTSLDRPGVRERLGSDVEFESLVTALIDRSQNNFMYLFYVLRDIEQARLGDGGLRDLPFGLRGYYERHWRKMNIGKVEEKLRLRTIYALAQLQRPVTASLLADCVGIEQLEIHYFLDDWAQFLEISRRKEPTGDESITLYSLYHKDFSDFLMDKEIIRAAGIDLGELHRQIGHGLLAGFDLDS